MKRLLARNSRKAQSPGIAGLDSSRGELLRPVGHPMETESKSAPERTMAAA